MEGEPICSTLTILEVVSLETVLGTGGRAERGVPTCTVALGYSGNPLPLSPSCPPP